MLKLRPRPSFVATGALCCRGTGASTSHWRIGPLVAFPVDNTKEKAGAAVQNHCRHTTNELASSETCASRCAPARWRAIPTHGATDLGYLRREVRLPPLFRLRESLAVSFGVGQRTAPFCSTEIAEMILAEDDCVELAWDALSFFPWSLFSCQRAGECLAES